MNDGERITDTARRLRDRIRACDLAARSIRADISSDEPEQSADLLEARAIRWDLRARAFEDVLDWLGEPYRERDAKL